MIGPPPINVAGLRKVFRQTTTGQSVIAIERLDLTIAPREVVAIVGQTGCGKSTFFDLMIGLEAPTEGAIRIGDKSPHTDFDLFRGRIATVFQQDRLLPWRSALDNAKLPLELIGLPEDEQRQRALTWLKRLGLEHFANAYPHELSGGMRQRVAIARAFVVQPDILLADEAFGHLDEVTAAELRETFLALARECGSTAILITHQLEEAIGVGDRIVVFGKSAKLLADIHVRLWPRSKHKIYAKRFRQLCKATSRTRACTIRKRQNVKKRSASCAKSPSRRRRPPRPCVDIKEADDPAGAAFEAFVAPRERADHAALAQHHLDVAAEIFRVRQALLKCPVVEREHVGRDFPSGFLVRVFERAEKFAGCLAMQFRELLREVRPHIADGGVHRVVAGAISMPTT